MDKSATRKYVSPIQFSPEVLEEMKNVPERGTPEYGEWLEEMRQAEFRNGLRAFTLDESLIALERERAGYNGLGELWGCVPTQTRM
jgi:hypothetical protein